MSTKYKVQDHTTTTATVTAYLDDFLIIKETNDWTAYPYDNGQLVNEKGRLLFTTNAHNKGALTSSTTVAKKGKLHSLTFDAEVIALNGTTVFIEAQQSNDGTSWSTVETITLSQLLPNQKYQLDFTPTQNFVRLYLDASGSTSAGNTAVWFNNFKISDGTAEAITGGGIGNKLAFKYRIYDASIGRFLSRDPLANRFAWNSPYAFSENRVIDMVELEGAESYSNELFNRAKKYGVSLIKKGTAYLIAKAVSAKVDEAQEETIEKLDEMSSSNNHIQQMGGLFGEFVLGVGPENRSFGPDAAITKSLKASNLTEEAVQKFWKGYQEYKDGKVDNLQTRYQANFGWPWEDSSPIEESPTSTAQFTGTAQYIFDYNEETGILGVTVMDNKNEWSFLGHQGEENEVRHDRGDAGRSSFMSNTYQTYNFSLSKKEVEDAVN